MSTTDADDFSTALNGVVDGWNRAMGLQFTRANEKEVVATFTVGPQHRQPYGIVHGGVHCGVIETVCSTGAALFAMKNGQSVVGLENHTSFLHAAREGTMTATAKPLTRGRRSQVWEATVTDEAGKIAATGRVRLICLDAGAEVGGRTVAIESGHSTEGAEPK